MCSSRYDDLGNGLLVFAVFVGGVVGGCGHRAPNRIEAPAASLKTARRAEGPDGREHDLAGEASWYGEKFHGQTTASGERYDMYAFTAAHKTLPFHTIVRVIHPKTRKSVVVRINDRGPYADGRIIDLSWAAAHDMGLADEGVIRVRLDVLRWGDGSRVATNQN
jgi:rare lipoprotein A